jgi:hypothetical protein
MVEPGPRSRTRAGFRKSFESSIASLVKRWAATPLGAIGWDGSSVSPDRPATSYRSHCPCPFSKPMCYEGMDALGLTLDFGALASNDPREGRRAPLFTLVPPENSDLRDIVEVWRALFHHPGPC